MRHDRDMSLSESVSAAWSTCDPDVRRSKVGWLALTPKWHSFRIGVVGRSEDDARHKFALSMGAWETLHEKAQERIRQETKEP